MNESNEELYRTTLENIVKYVEEREHNVYCDVMCETIKEVLAEGDQMEDALSVIKSKNLEDVTQKELDAFRLMIEEAMRCVDKLQSFHTELTGRHYVPPIRL